MGYTSKQVIHPNQAGPVQEAFTLRGETIAHARRVVDAAEEHQKTGVGAFTLGGKMVDAVSSKPPNECWSGRGEKVRASSFKVEHPSERRQPTVCSKMKVSRSKTKVYKLLI